MRTPGLIAKKIGMTRMVEENGKIIPVTILHIEDQKVTKVLTEDRDGYNAIQVGFQAKREKLLTKSDVTRLRKTKIEENYSRFKEFRIEAAGDAEGGFEIGHQFKVDTFEGIASVDVTGISKGKGFQGAVKRWGAKTGRQTHGSRFHRRPGSLGQRSTPGRVFKNKHMPGHMGCVQKTIQNLDLITVDAENGILAVKGSVPGHKNSYLVVKPSLKKVLLGKDGGGDAKKAAK